MQAMEKEVQDSFAFESSLVPQSLLGCHDNHKNTIQQSTSKRPENGVKTTRQDPTDFEDLVKIVRWDLSNYHALKARFV